MNSEKSPEYKKLHEELGEIMTQWADVLYNIEACLCAVNYDAVPFIGMAIPSRIANMEDMEKISEFVEAYEKNEEYHISDHSGFTPSAEDVKKILDKGRLSRNYFAHRLFIYDDDNENLFARPKKRIQEGADVVKFELVVREDFERELNHIREAYDFVIAFRYQYHEKRMREK